MSPYYRRGLFADEAGSVRTNFYVSGFEGQVFGLSVFYPASTLLNSYFHHAHLPWCRRPPLKESVEQRRQDKRVLLNVYSAHKGCSSYTYSTAVCPGSSFTCVTTSRLVSFIFYLFDLSLSVLSKQLLDHMQLKQRVSSGP